MRQRLGIQVLKSGMMAVCVCMIASLAQAQCATGSCGATDSFAANWGKGAQPLFNNYFTHGAADQADAGLYISPVGVPGWVGHTYNTYQPFYPHEMTWIHKDRYHSYYDNGRGMNRTSAHYYAPPVRTAVNRVYRAIEIPR